RLCAITLALAPALLQRLLLPFGVFAGVSTLLAIAAALRSRPQAEGGAASPLTSPFDLGVVFKFALVLAVVMAATRILSALYGAAGLLPLAALGGLVDTDAVTLATARLTTEGLDLRLGGYAIMLAAAADGISKMAIAAMVGGVRFGGLFAGGTLLAAAAALATMYFGS
ncbi:MAG: DUF4010 domain-containing protein, partial [Caulobacteraceae bacterium]